MRRLVVLGGAAAVLAYIVVRRLRAAEPGVPGTLPRGAGSGANSRLNGPLYDEVAKRLALRPDDDLLDVACGEGAFLAGYATSVGQVAGLDLSEAKIRLARQRLSARIAAGTAEIVEGDAGKLPWGADHFSVVTSMDALTLMPDPERVLAEICRVLRPGGRAVMQVGWRVPDGTETHRRLRMAWVWDEAEVRRMTEAAGFRDVTVSYIAIGGDSRLLNGLGRLLMGTDELRLVEALKPATMAPSDTPAEAPSLRSAPDA
jgi:SAM-dependent methyltransferase